jgi:hypothetical protein
VRLISRLIKVSLLAAVVAGIALVAKNASSFLKPTPAIADADEAASTSTEETLNDEEGSL